MKILVTGGAGFIGSNVADAYIAKGHDVWIIDNIITGSKNNINPKATFIEMDVRDKKIKDLFKEVGFDIVNHHAAQIDIRKSVEDPAFDAAVNIIGALNLYENCYKYNVKKVIFISSGGAIYGECDIPKDETAEKCPISPYGITKYTNELYLKFYEEIHSLKYTVLRYGNVYGPRQNPKGEAGVVSIFSTNILEDNPCYIYGDGSQKRDYVFVGDVVKANLKVLENFNNETFNIGTAIPTDVNKLYSKMKNIYGCDKDAIHAEARAGELARSVLNVDKMKNLLKIEPITMDEGLKLTAEYYKNLK